MLTKIDGALTSVVGNFSSFSLIQANNSYMGRSIHNPHYPVNKHRIFVPRQSCLHRQAAIALYRALLTQCRATPFAQQDKVSLQEIVRNRFHANRDKTSGRLLRLHFQAGYKALDHLDGAVANHEPSITTITTYLSQTPQHLKDPRPPPPPPRVIPKDHHAPPPEHKFLANFPRSHVEGIRKVPFFVPAHNISFVRFKKPQPYNLTRTIRQLTLQRQIRMDLRDDLEYYHLPIADYEDRWDEIIKRELKVDEGDQATFTDPMHYIQDQLSILIDERDTKAVNLALRQWNIVQEEKKLAVKERDERRRIAWEKRQERYRLEGRIRRSKPVTSKASVTWEARRLKSYHK